jgi:hypothetical protein
MSDVTYNIGTNLILSTAVLNLITEKIRQSFYTVLTAAICVRSCEVYFRILYPCVRSTEADFRKLYSCVRSCEAYFRTLYPCVRYFEAYFKTLYPFVKSCEV